MLCGDCVAIGSRCCRAACWAGKAGQVMLASTDCCCILALPQVHAALKDWALSEQYYLQAAQSSEVRRCWVGT